LVSAGALSAGAVSPGEIVSIFGINIGPSEPVSLTLDASGRVATRLAGEQVQFDGTPAPLLYVSRNQINAIAPYGVAGKTTTQVMVNSQGQTSAPVTIPVRDVTPAIFTLDDSGHGQGAILNEDGSLNSARNPAARSSIVTLFGTGEGQTNPGGVDGKIAAQPLPIPIQEVRVTIAGADASVEYAGAAPREVAGLLQVNARVPSSIPPGDQPVILTIGQTRSQNGVTMVVR